MLRFVIVGTIQFCCGTCLAQTSLLAVLELFQTPVEVGFGGSAAMNGDLIAVGSGGLTIFERESGGWIQTFAIEDIGGTVTSSSTLRVEIAGQQVIVGVPGAEVGGIAGAGAVYVFEKLAGDWVIVEELFASSATFDAQFGKSLAADGGFLLVGAPGDSDAAPGAGAAYVFETDGWSELQKLTGSAAQPNDDFGQTVSVRNEWAAMGMPGRGAYAFRLLSGLWEEVEHFPGPPPPTAYGCAVAVEGPLVVVGDLSGSGRATVHEYDGSTWTATEIVPGEPQAGAGFGAPLRLLDGNLLIGEVGRDVVGIGSGRVTLLRLELGNWNEIAYLQPEDLSSFNGFGSAIGMDESLQVCVGAAVDDTAGPNAGSVYVFHLGAGFIRGDANRDDALDISDPVFLLNALFGGGVLLGCEDAADSNDDGTLDISDAITGLTALFVPGSPPPAPPSPACGQDPTFDFLSCTDQQTCVP